MYYVISDIHGCSRELKLLLNQIHFSDEDTLYILGDCVDRGPDPVGVLEILSSYFNVFPLMGNHEYMMMKALPPLLKASKEKDPKKAMSKEALKACDIWLGDCGKVTLDQFQELSEEDQEFYLEYLEEMTLYEEVEVKEHSYFLIHSLPADFQPGQSIDDLISRPLNEILTGRPNFAADWEQDTIYIIGHTPTHKVPGAQGGKAFRKGNLIDIDCGCCTGHALCAFCLDTQEYTYVQAKMPEPEY